MSIVVMACDDESLDNTPADVTLTFNAMVGTEALQIATNSYDNPGGVGNFTVADFKFYISNLKLINSAANTAYVEENSYHLVRYDIDNNSFQIDLSQVPADNYDQLEFSIGVDPTTNVSTDNFGDLDPNNQMAWNWDVGYKFFLMEGEYFAPGDGTPDPLVFHIGFDENFATLQYSLSLDLFNNKDATLNFNVDLSEAFKNPNPIDFQQLSTVKFVKPDAELVAENYLDMITLVVQQQ